MYSHIKMCVCVCLFVLQDKKSPVSSEGLPFKHGGTHAGKIQERHRGNQTRPDQRRFQEEQRWVRPAGPC